MEYLDYVIDVCLYLMDDNRGQRVRSMINHESLTDVANATYAIMMMLGDNDAASNLVYLLQNDKAPDHFAGISLNRGIFMIVGDSVLGFKRGTTGTSKKGAVFPRKELADQFEARYVDDKGQIPFLGLE